MQVLARPIHLHVLPLALLLCGALLMVVPTKLSFACWNRSGHVTTSLRLSSAPRTSKTPSGLTLHVNSVLLQTLPLASSCIFDMKPTRKGLPESATFEHVSFACRLMGFGHRVYKTYDPRAKIMKQVCDEVLEHVGIR